MDEINISDEAKKVIEEIVIGCTTVIISAILKNISK